MKIILDGWQEMSKYNKDWHLLWQIIKRIHIHRYNTKTVSLVMMQLYLKKTLHLGEKHTPGVFTFRSGMATMTNPITPNL